jgi:P pilus assembly chaperone PapD
MKRKVGFVLGLFALITGFSQLVSAQGNLLVAPIRVVFEGAKQKEDLNLTNIGQDSATYLVSFIHYKMKEDGSFIQLENVDSITTRSDKYLRIFPRKVVLPPGESQTIRMQYRKPADLKDGEYRSHLYFRAEKEVSALGMNTTQSDTTKMSVSITPVFGISIPVIIRNGNLDYKMSLSDAALTAVNDTISNLSFSINRSGNRSSYGNLRAEFIPAVGKPFDVGLANGVGVYTDLSVRKFSMLIRNRAEQRLKNGKLVIHYSLPREEGDTELAKTELRIP